ncbi:hypothetical protein HAX54_039796 [Datura stramonium]|uniref:Uncharacterized protein n=1 Tax=Datura stramonium TaxID=4076 RepID=A0ABS8SJL0_DATST|nr:hypothetical protein [Datura stramonium]
MASENNDSLIAWENHSPSILSSDEDQGDHMMLCVRDCMRICMNLDNVTSKECEGACRNGCEPLLARKEIESPNNFNATDFVITDMDKANDFAYTEAKDINSYSNKEWGNVCTCREGSMTRNRIREASKEMDSFQETDINMETNRRRLMIAARKRIETSQAIIKIIEWREGLDRHFDWVFFTELSFYMTDVARVVRDDPRFNGVSIQK